jgi:hypothetical protein
MGKVSSSASDEKDAASPQGGSGASRPTGDAERPGFNYGAYLATDGTPVELIGRTWGVMMKANLPKDEVRVIAFDCKASFEDFHSLVRNRWARIRREDLGFTLFSRMAGEWFDTLVHYLALEDVVVGKDDFEFLEVVA